MSEEGVWKSYWIEILKNNKSKLDLSSGDLDGSNTTALRDREEVDTVLKS